MVAVDLKFCTGHDKQVVDLKDQNGIELTQKHFLQQIDLSTHERFRTMFGDKIEGSFYEKSYRCQETRFFLKVGISDKKIH